MFTLCCEAVRSENKINSGLAILSRMLSRQLFRSRSAVGADADGDAEKRCGIDDCG
eukprot:SAG31_NODE_532_length_14374_cov_30.565254_16_plen_56_part_00